MAFCAYVLDGWDGVTTDTTFDAVLIGLVSLLSALAFALSRKRAYLLIPVALCLELVVINAIDFSPVKPAKRAIKAIHPGMSEGEVRSILDLAFPENGRFHRPEMGPLRYGVLSFVLDPRDGRYNAAVVEVTFRNGKVVSSRFLSD